MRRAPAGDGTPWLRCLTLGLSALLALACGGSSTPSNLQPPKTLAYAANPAVYTKGTAITPDTPSNTGGPASSYAVTPALPAGLDLNGTTGVLSGTPSAVAATATYTVTASNTGGSTSTALTITVKDVPPASLTYAMNPAVYAKGVAITPNAPSSTGGAVVSYAISPNPPAGLSLDPATGILSGTPSAAAATASYTITATNSGGSTSTSLALTVNDAPPSSLTYSTPSAIYIRGTAITPNTPSSSGGAVLVYAITPAPPLGLTLDPVTGILSGTPATTATPAAYTISAMNSGGSATAVLWITVNDAPPGGLAYAANPAVYTKGVTIAPNLPASTGGAVASYAVSPVLPAGLVLDPVSGVLSGTPTAITPQITYTITATNVSGSAAVALPITVNDVPPSGLTYSQPFLTCTKGTLLAPDTPSSAGGAVTRYGISPALPAGLVLDPATGILSGTPTAVAPRTAYTLTASNSGGDATAQISLAVNEAPPAGLAYAVPAPIYTKGTAIAPNAPSSTGGPVSTYAITPALPAGLTLDSTTGILSGTPAVLAPLATYTVTASNTGGSVTTQLAITVADLPPTGLAYAMNPATFFQGLAITPDAPSTSGGPVVSYAVAPALPPGLSLDLATGILSGTPTALAATAPYTVTATNSGGSTTALLTLTVKDATPVISYGSGSFTFTTQAALSPLAPTNTGGPVGTWAITPALPAGLSFSATDGSISGTPTAITPATSYTITATNTGGTCTVSLVLTVNPPPPTLTTQPASQVVPIGHNASFSASATGSGSLSYQWLDNGTAIPGANILTYTTPPVTLADSGHAFTLLVQDTYGQSVNSNAAILTVVQGAFSITPGTLGTVRYGHTATLLPNGKVLITGGSNGVSVLANAELYDPATGTFAPTAGPMGTARIHHAATLLPNGKVLITGGYNGTSVLASAELYDPASGTFRPTSGAMGIARQDHTSTRLPNGKVLIAGGDFNSAYASAELFDPATGAFSPTGSMSASRALHTATLLPTGKVLIAGGGDIGSTYTSAELYDPGTGSFSSTGSLNTGRSRHTATLLPDGKVLLAEGQDANGAYLAGAELYDPTTGTFAPTGSLGTARCNHSAVLLPDGRVLLTAGSGTAGVLSSSEAYDPASGTFSPTGPLAMGRTGQTATRLPNGKVLVAGGFSGTGAIGESEAFDPQDPAPGVFTATGSMGTARARATATLLPNGKILVAGGTGISGTTYASAELYDPDSGAFTPTGTMAYGRDQHTATLLPNGKILIAGGISGLNYPLVAELYDPSKGTFTATGSMAAPRRAPTATLLPNGKVLIAGGANAGGALASAELYDPASGTFTPTGSMSTPREFQTALLLPDGTVLVAGGDNGSTELSSAEIYDPATGIFTPTGSMISPRGSATATLLPNGLVLVCGGWDGSADVASAERYDPAKGTFTATGSMTVARSQQQATLLPGGLVLVAGGTNGGVTLASAERYDPAKGTFSPAGSMLAARGFFSALLLPNGKILAAGGYDGTTYLASVELYQ